MNRIDAFLELAVNQGGSDLHLLSGQPPRIRLHGDLQPVRFRELSEHDVTEFLHEFMTPAQREKFLTSSAVDFAYESETAGRFRVNVYRHMGGIAAAMRVVSAKVPTLASLDLPAAVTNSLAIGKGFVVRKGDEITGDLVFEHGAALVNGKKLGAD